jgi:surface polysaccharide O-acyltransferase-like enzyme
MVEPTAFHSFHLRGDEAEATWPHPAAQTSVALDNLRGIVILIVLAFHSLLAYVSWVDAPTADFDSPPYAWRAFPIVDSHRFFGFDLFCAWQDVYLMSLMFFLSGLFVWPSLQRKKTRQFLRDRLLRLGLPYAVGIALIVPVAEYPAYAVTAAEPSLDGYWHALLALPFWPNGPLWFLWQLLAINIVAALVHALAPNALPALGRRCATATARPLSCLAALLALSALAYVPLAVAFTPWQWSNAWILAVQLCRPLQYAVYFFAGVGIGVAGIDRGVLAVDGPLPPRWGLGLAAALASLAMWMGLTGLTLGGGASVGMVVAAALAYVPACAAGCFFLIAVSLRFAAGYSRILGGLAANAYGLYLLHYVFVVWAQYALLGAPLPAVVKAPIVFGVTVVLTWIVVNALHKVPLGARVIGSARHGHAALAPSAPR